MDTVTHKDGDRGDAQGRPQPKWHRNNTPVDLWEDDGGNEEEEEAEAALAVLAGQGKGVAVEACRAASSS